MSVFKSSIFILFSLLVLESPLWGMEPPSKDDEIFGAFGAKLTISGPDDFQEEAEKMFPSRGAEHLFPKDKESREYLLKKLVTVFPPLLHTELTPYFHTGFSIMLGEHFPPPKHKSVTLNAGYQCLYRKIAYASTLRDDEERKAYQLDALNKLFAFHKESITHFDKIFGDQIPAFPCESCLKTANKEYEIPTNENKADSP